MFESEPGIPQWAEDINLSYKLLYQTMRSARSILGQRGLLERQLAFDIQNSFYEALQAMVPENLPEFIPLEEDQETVARPDILSGLAGEGVQGWEVRFRRILYFLPKTYEKYEVHHSENDASFFPFHETFKGFSAVREIANQCEEKRGKILFLDATPWTKKAVVELGLEKEGELNTYEIERALVFFEKIQRDLIEEKLRLVKETAAIQRAEKEKEYAPQIRRRVLNFVNAAKETPHGKTGIFPKWIWIGIAAQNSDQEALFFLTDKERFVVSPIKRAGILKQILMMGSKYEPALKKAQNFEPADSEWIRYGEYVSDQFLSFFSEKIREAILNNALR